MKTNKILRGILTIIFTLLIDARAQVPFTNSLVAYYPFNGNANDASGNGNNGTLFGAAAFGVDRFGNSNSCLSLPGTQGTRSGVDVPSLSNMPFFPVTYSAWFWLNSCPPSSPNTFIAMTLLGREQCGDYYEGAICITIPYSGTQSNLTYYTGATGYWLPQLVPPTNQWCQVVLTIDQTGSPNFYVNGTNVPGTGSAPNGQPLDFRIGASDFGGCGGSTRYVWNGLIDDVRIYNRALSSNEVQELYAYEAVPQPSAPVPSGLIFVANYGSGTISEYNLDGSTVNASLVSGLNGPFGLAVSGGDIFVASRGSGTIGEYNLDGLTVNASLVSGLNEPIGIAVSGGDIFVTITYGPRGCGTIGEYTTAGATVNAALVSDCANLAYPVGIAVSGGYIFVVNNGPGTIGEYTTAGATVNAALVSGLNGPFGLAVSGGHIYVANYGSGTIGQYNLDGSTVNAALVSGLNGPVMIDVEPSPMSITNQPASATNNLGDNLVLSVGASGTPQDYTWYFSGTNIDNGSNSTLIISNVSQPYFGNYYVVVSNAFNSVTSSVATIYEPATIISEPGNVVAPLYSSPTFSVSAVGYPAPTFYQWTLNQSNIVGTNSNILTISNMTINDTGNYQVLVSNSIGSTVSTIATLNMSPSIYTPFIGATPIWGTSATLSVGAIGSGTLTYQWYFNGQPVQGANYPQLNFSSIQFTNNGFYSVVISSPYGSVTNIAEQVAVNPASVTLGFYPGLTITGAAGNTYIIQRSADLSNTNNWTSHPSHRGSKKSVGLPV